MCGYLFGSQEYKPGSVRPSSIKLDLHPKPVVDLGLSFQYSLFNLSGYLSEIGYGQWACLGLGQVSFKHTESFSYTSSITPDLIMKKLAETWEQ